MDELVTKGFLRQELSVIESRMDVIEGRLDRMEHSFERVIEELVKIREEMQYYRQTERVINSGMIRLERVTDAHDERILRLENAAA